MLILKFNCECCSKDLLRESTEARNCSIERTFCAACADKVLNGRCSNCGGELVPRRRRSEEILRQPPASIRRVYKPDNCAELARR